MWGVRDYYYSACSIVKPRIKKLNDHFFFQFDFVGEIENASVRYVYHLYTCSCICTQRGHVYYREKEKFSYYYAQLHKYIELHV